MKDFRGLLETEENASSNDAQKAVSPFAGRSKPILVFLAVGAAYFVVAKAGLTLASINPSATPIWPATGVALAAVLIWGYRVGPAIFIAAFAVNVTTAGSIYTSSAIAFGNTLEALVGGYLINLWCEGTRAFDSPSGIVRFSFISLAASTPISATIGVGSLALAGYASWAHVPSIWMTWWLGDLAGALVVAPILILWMETDLRALSRKDMRDAAVAFAGAIAVGVIAFSPLIEQTAVRGPLSFLAIFPLMWAALHLGQRETATVAFILSASAVWGTLLGGGPFAQTSLNDSFLLLLMFMISTSIPSLALSADIAARRRTLDETKGSLHQAQKMEALGQLTGGIAHEFNNLLTTIINSLDPALGSDQDIRRQQRNDRALQAARNGAALVQQLLVFGRKRTAALKPTNVNGLVQETLNLFRGVCPENVQVSIDLKLEPPWANADYAQLQTAILNLLVNSRDAMPTGGTLRIATESVAADLADTSTTERVLITVADSGTGMPPDVLRRAFEPFFTTKEIGKGTGLGLSMVYSAIQQMGGEVDIDSAERKGTTVRVFLPSIAAAVPSSASATDQSSDLSRAREPSSVLYVEDDALVRLSTADMLESAGYAVISVPDAKAALEQLDRRPDIEVMVTDVGLPGMNGHQLAVEARRRRPGLKVLFVTGYDHTGQDGSAPEKSFTEYLGKPYQPAQLFDAIQRLAET